MKLLKRENWWAWLLLFFGSQGTSVFMLGALLDVYDKKYWYSKWYYWVIGTLFFFPLIIMLIVFYIQILSKIAFEKLKTQDGNWAKVLPLYIQPPPVFQG